MSRNGLIRALALTGLLAALGAGYAVTRLQPPSFHGTDLGPSSVARDFMLEAADRGPVRLSDYRGRVVLLFFGYTSCPDICPVTMARLRRVVEGLGDRRSDVQVILVTVDPAVDTPAKLREYVQSFDPGFVGLGGERATLAAVAADFGAWAGEAEDEAAVAPEAHAGHEGHEERAGGAAPASAVAAARMIPHTSHIFGIDRSGAFRVLWAPDLTAEQIAEDVRGLLRR
ncbi:MAG: SCO family protein [Gemmatimonadetes bacterium]|nr:SCO family protein [Gemmatimonadota bacterium]